MADKLTQLVESIPFLQGAFRRRLSAGTIVFLLVFVSDIRRALQAPGGLVDPSSLSPGLLILITAVAYAAGAIVETLAEILISVIGNCIWAVAVPLTWFSHRPRHARYLLRGLCWYPGFGVLAIYYGFRGVLGFSDFRWLGLHQNLTDGARVFIEAAPAIVRTGLWQPFGVEHEVAWRWLESAGGTRDTKWLRALAVRNLDLRISLTAVTLGVTALFSRQISQSQSWVESLAAAQVGIVVVVVLIYGYVFVTKRTIVSALEMLVLSRSSLAVHTTAAATAEQPAASAER